MDRAVTALSAPAGTRKAGATARRACGRRIGSIPRLDAPRGDPHNPIRGSINDRIAWADGCAFAPRCDRYEMGCLTGTPQLTEPRAAGHQVRCVNPVLDDAKAEEVTA